MDILPKGTCPKFITFAVYMVAIILLYQYKNHNCHYTFCLYTCVCVYVRAAELLTLLHTALRSLLQLNPDPPNNIMTMERNRREHRPELSWIASVWNSRRRPSAVSGQIDTRLLMNKSERTNQPVRATQMEKKKNNHNSNSSMASKCFTPAAKK